MRRSPPAFARRVHLTGEKPCEQNVAPSESCWKPRVRRWVKPRDSLLCGNFPFLTRLVVEFKRHLQLLCGCHATDAYIGGINALRSLTHKQIARLKNHASSLLLLRFWHNEMHHGPDGHLDDGFSVSRIILLAFDERLHIGMW